MKSLDPTFPLFPVFSLLGFVLCTIPLSWHIQAWNAGTCAYMVWTGLQCLIEFINSLIWAGNVNDIAPVWCDISSQILQGAGIGIPASVLCISRRLYKITSSRAASTTRRDKIRALVIDLCISVGIPLLGLVLHFIVQPHRYDILEDIGCYPVTYNTLPAYFLTFTWPIVLGCTSFVYSGLNLRNFYRQRLQFSQFSSSISAMNASRYLRLMTLSTIDMMFTVPLTIFTLYNGAKGTQLQPWISWEDTHFNFKQVHLFPAIFWRSQPGYKSAVELTRWSSVFCALLFFTLFGFASEAKKHYRIAFWWMVKPFGLRPSGPSGPKSPLDGWKRDPNNNKVPISPITQKYPGSGSDLDSPSLQRPRHMTVSSTVSTGTAYSSNGDDIEKGLSSPTTPTTTTLTCIPSPPPAYSTSGQHDVGGAPSPDTPRTSTLNGFDTDSNAMYIPLHDFPMPTPTSIPTQEHIIPYLH